MKSLCIGIAAILTLVAPFHTIRAAVEKPEPSQLSIYAGKYAGTLSYSGLLSGPAEGVFKASSTKEKGSYNVMSTVSESGIQITINESFTFNGKKLVYSILIAAPTPGLTASGSGVGKVTARKRGLNFTANILLTNGTQTAPATITGVFLPRKKSMRVTTQIGYGGQSVALDYQLQKKGK